jgi:hypothetical protein
MRDRAWRRKQTSRVVNNRKKFIKDYLKRDISEKSLGTFRKTAPLNCSCTKKHGICTLHKQRAYKKIRRIRQKLFLVKEIQSHIEDNDS